VAEEKERSMVPVILTALPAILAMLLVAATLVLVVILVRLELRRRRQPRLADAVKVEPGAPVVASPPAPPPIPALPVASAPLAGAYLQLATVVGQAPQRFPLTASPVTIGRDPTCTISVAEGLTVVSRHHAQIERDGDDYILTDLSSENGVFVNGTRIGRNLLRDGAVISLAQVVAFTFHADHRSQP
jgi:hypothetical protein